MCKFKLIMNIFNMYVYQYIFCASEWMFFPDMLYKYKLLVLIICMDVLQILRIFVIMMLWVCVVLD